MAYIHVDMMGWRAPSSASDAAEDPGAAINSAGFPQCLCLNLINHIFGSVTKPRASAERPPVLNRSHF